LTAASSVLLHATSHGRQRHPSQRALDGDFPDPLRNRTVAAARPAHRLHAGRGSGLSDCLVTLPVGASLPAAPKRWREFSQLGAQAAGVQATFAITGLNLLTGTNSSYAATIFHHP